MKPAPTMVPPRYPGRAGFQPAGELHWLCADRFVLPRCPGCAGFQPAGELHWLCADRFVLSMPWVRGLPAHSGGGFETRPHYGATDALGV